MSDEGMYKFLGGFSKTAILNHLSTEASDACCLTKQSTLNRITPSRQDDLETTDLSHSPNIFICYSHKDNTHAGRKWIDLLDEHLGYIKRQHGVKIWSDRKLEIGEEWDDEIRKQLEVTNVAILLVGPSFLGSEYITNSELPVILLRARERKCLVLPLIIRHCQYDVAVFKFPDPVSGPNYKRLSVFQKIDLMELNPDEIDKKMKIVADRIGNHLRLFKDSNA